MAGAVERDAVIGVASATTDRLDSLRARAAAVPPPLIALALAGVAMAGHYALWGSSAPWGHAAVAGALLAAAGWVWVLWSVALFRQAGTPLRPTATPIQLIEEGPYRVGRHPMYLGIGALMLGAALGVGSPLLAGAALLFGAIVNAVHVPHEEAQLARRFGGWWRDYASGTRRWL